MDEKNNFYKENKKKKDLSSFIKENWFVLFLIISFLITAISLFINNLILQQIPIQENTWNGITPGYSKQEQLIKMMGEPLDIIETENGSEIKYKSDFPAVPNKVETNKEGTVQFIKEYLLYDETHLLSQYISEYGEPNISLIDNESGDAFKAHVFLDEGLVIVAHNVDGSVEQKWYFEPTTAEIFLSSWGNNLSLNGPGSP
ncbi:MAG: hypothetical protein GW942_02170 [Candidatus Pacebacteria bacterium]|nr:hypothetical protein [Candidatus Paceibacterota bacterium]